jgi:transposase
VDPHLKKLEQENRYLTRRLQKAEALLAYQKKVSELLQIPLKPFESDEDD